MASCFFIPFCKFELPAVIIYNLQKEQLQGPMTDSSADFDHDSVPVQLPQPFLLFFHPPLSFILPPSLLPELSQLLLPSIASSLISLSFLPPSLLSFLPLLFLYSYSIPSFLSDSSFLITSFILAFAPHFFFWKIYLINFYLLFCFIIFNL